MKHEKYLIVVNYNDYNSCFRFLDSVKDYSSLDGIVVVDNCSTDNSFGYLMARYGSDSKIHIIKSDYNGGYAAGNNTGCKYAIDCLNAQYLIIANPDISFSEEVLQKIIRFYNSHKNEKVGGVTVRMRCLSGINLPSAWKLPKYKDCLLGNLFIIRRVIGDQTRYDDSIYENDWIDVDVIAGSFFILKADTYLDIDGFDERTFLYCEENILAYRLHAKGYRNYLLPRLYFDHFHSVSINKNISNIRKKMKIANDSWIVYAKYYLGCSETRIMLLRISYEIGSRMYALAAYLRDRIKNVYHLLGIN